MAKQRSTDRYVTMYEHASSRTILLKDGSALAMYEVDGFPAQTLEDAELMRRRRQWNHVLCGFSGTDNAVLFNWICRGLAHEGIYPGGSFNSDFAREVDRRYRTKLFDRFLYLNKTYVGVMIRPARLAGEWMGDQVAKVQAPRDVADEPPEDRLERLARVCDNFETSLAPYKPRRLGLRFDRGRVFSEMLEALAFAMTGVWRSVGLQTAGLVGSFFSERIITKRETIEIRMPGHSRWACCFGWKQPPFACPPGTLDGFLSSNFQSTIMQSFRPMGRQQSLDAMRKQQHRLVSANDPAYSQMSELTLAMDEVQSGRMVMGDHHLVVTAFADSLKATRDVANEAWHLLQDAGAQVAREDLGLEGAYFSMLPGNSRFRPRPGMISSWNYASLAAMHAYPAGDEKGRWGDPLAIFRSTGGTPVRFHLQTRNGVGNIFVFGETGSGKTAWLAFLITQCERLGIQVVLWDKDRGLELTVRAVGGRYLALRNPTGLAPLKALTDSPQDIHHLAQLVRGMISCRDGYSLTPEENRRLFVGLRGIMALPPEDRWMGDLRTFLGAGNDGAGARLEPWCKDFDGEYAWVADNERDEVKLDAHVLGFDVTEFLTDKMVCGPVMTHLLYRTGKLADGRRIAYIIDEGWRVVDIPEFSDSAMDNMKTDRKKNAAFIFATQSVRDGLQSKIGDTIREQCKTIVGFAVERPRRADFQELKFNDRECEIIETLPPGEGMFLLRQNGRSVVGQLALHGMNDILAVLSGNETNVRLMDKVRERIGEDNPVQLIEAFHRERELA